LDAQVMMRCWNANGGYRQVILSEPEHLLDRIVQLFFVTSARINPELFEVLMGANITVEDLFDVAEATKCLLQIKIVRRRRVLPTYRQNTELKPIYVKMMSNSSRRASAPDCVDCVRFGAVNPLLPASSRVGTDSSHAAPR
jgi:hypothetical protein